MSITSLTFFLFAAVTLVVYYCLPKKWQWYVLLAASLVFYCAGGAKSVIYVLITATVIYFATLGMQRISDAQREYLKQNKAVLSREEKSAYKARQKKKRKAMMLAALLVNLAILCTFKYFHFALAQINHLIRAVGAREIRDTVNLIVPLGISFYTFQSIGYLLDVYWEFYKPERNYGKVLLFVSFFPQITQGPISNFEQLSAELFTEHTFTYCNYAWGFQRMLWGFAKKMIVANILSVYVGRIFEGFQDHSGITALFGMFCYSVQIYADFSGYMDIMCGYCEMLGIRLTENFDRPYFSKSVAEYWRRWHISLGTWFKKYVYYPIGMSGWSRRLAKQCGKKLGKYFADTIPATIALVVVWFATGLWHGASWSYILWGGVNGFFIILTLWLEPVYSKVKTALRIRESSRLWAAFQTIRTFLLVTFIKVLPEVGTLTDGLRLWKHVFVNHELRFDFRWIVAFPGSEMGVSYLFFLLAAAGTAAMFAASLLQRKKPVRTYFNELPAAVRIPLVCGLLFVALTLGTLATFKSGNGGFLYAQF